MAAMIEFANIRGVEKIKKGGQATVYKAPPGSLHMKISESVAIKKYSKKALLGNERAVEQYLKIMLDNRKDAPPDIRGVIDQYIIWPRVIIYENGEACGFAMNLIPDRFFVRYDDITGPQYAESNFDFILNDPEIRLRLGLPVLNAHGRVKITHDLLMITSQLHKYDIVIGDVSPNNILIYIDPQAQRNNRALFIDSDSFRKANHTHPLKQPHTPNWYPPESWAAMRLRLQLERAGGNPNQIMRYRTIEFIQNKQTDVYKICLAVTRLFHDGAQRASVSESSAAYEKMSREIGEEFALYVYNGLSANPADRPSGHELYVCFRDAIGQKNKLRGKAPA